MKHKTEVLIDADRDTVWRFFDNPDNMTRWQPTLKSFTHVSGIPGQAGERQTRWSSNTNHVFKGFMKVMALFMRKSICDRIDADMQRFKLLVETELAEEGS